MWREIMWKRVGIEKVMLWSRERESVSGVRKREIVVWNWVNESRERVWVLVSKW